MNCTECKHSFEIEGDAAANDSEKAVSFICQRYPPTSSMVPQQHPITREVLLAQIDVFPRVHAGMVCGEFEAVLPSH